MFFTAKPTSEPWESMRAESLQKACELAAMLSEDFGTVDVTRDVCGPKPILATYCNGRAV